MKKILIVKTSSLGDIIHVYPVIDFLHKQFPQAQIDWVVEAPFAELVQAHPYVHKAIPVATKAWRKAPFKRDTLKALYALRQNLRACTYDAVIDLQGNFKSGLIVSQAKSSIKVGFASKSVPEWANMLFTNRRFNPIGKGNIRQDYLSLVASFLKAPIPQDFDQINLKIAQEQQTALQSILNQPIVKNKTKILVCSGSAWPNKQLTQNQLADFLALVQKETQGVLLFAWGSPAEQQVAQYLHAQFPQCSLVIDRLKLATLQNLMANCDLVIAMDSLPLHLAGTTNTPSFSVFGASSAAKYKPLGPNHFAFQGACPYGRTFEKRCPILRTCPTGACIHDLPAQTLFDAFRSWWSSQR